MSAIDPIRFRHQWANLGVPGSCHIWIGSRDGKGYGKFWDGERNVGAHRASYVLAHGQIPEGLVIDHLCRVRACVNPDHLEPVTQRENTIRGVGPTARNAITTHCKRGHEFTEENTYQAPAGWRACRICRSAEGLTRRAAQKAVAA